MNKKILPKTHASDLLNYLADQIPLRGGLANKTMGKYLRGLLIFSPGALSARVFVTNDVF